MIRALVVAAVIASGTSASAQGIDGYASVLFAVMPRVEAGERVGVASTRLSVIELRPRLFAERRFEPSERVRFTAAGFVDGLVARRHAAGTSTGAAVILRPQELHVEVLWPKADLRVGLTRVVWGRLDEFLPTDVINPLDLSRFFLDNRSEARLPTGVVRARVLPSESVSVEAVYVPLFRRGRFDQLDEESSPFNLTPDVFRRELPERRWGNGQGGVRASFTSGRADWSVSAYRGFEPFPVLEAVPRSATERDVTIVGRHPRFTMVGADVETVRGPWGVRGELAVFAKRTLTVEGRSIEGGAGVDRRAGDYRVSATLLVTRQYAVGQDLAVTPLSPDLNRTLIFSLERAFARQTRSLRGFAAYNTDAGSAFARALATFELRNNVLFDLSAGWFAGDGFDVLSRLASRDFVFSRLRVFF